MALEFNNFIQISKDCDLNDFLIDFSGFLKELRYTFEALTGDGNINSRLQTVESRYLLLEFLISELMTHKMMNKISMQKDKTSQVVKNVESPVAVALKDIAIALSLGKPPDKISSESLFSKITTQLDETVRIIPDAMKRIGKPLFNPKKPLTNDQWNQVAKIQSQLDDEYNLRRKMLMTRLDVTIQSFKWSADTAKESKINERFSNKLQQIEKIQFGGRQTDIVALLAARDKIAIIEKTSSANVRRNTASKLQRHIIGKVPDRGGRALEQQKPPPEMPSWQKRQAGGDNRGRGGHRGGRGFHQQQQGFPQDHYQQRQQHNPSNYSGGGGGESYGQNYQGNDGNFHRGGGHQQRGGRVQGNWNQSQRGQRGGRGQRW